MKKIVALTLALLLLANSAVCVFASTNEVDSGVPSNAESSESTEISDSEESTPDFFEVAGYSIPTETGIDVFEYAPYTFTENGSSYKLFTNGNDDYVQSELYRDGVLRQKSVGIKGSPLVIYTEIYDLETQEEIDSAELDISDQDDLVLLKIHKAVSHETMDDMATNDKAADNATTDDEVTNDEIIDGDTTDSVQTPPVNSVQTNAAAASTANDPMHNEPAFNTGLVASTYSGDSGYYKLGVNRFNPSGSTTYTGTLYRKRNSFNYIGLGHAPKKFDIGTTISEITSFILTFVIDPSKASVVAYALGLVESATSHDVTLNVELYDLDVDYKVRVNSAGNNVYCTKSRTITYYRFLISENNKNSYEIKCIKNGYPLDNPSMVNEGITNYVEYKFYDIVNHWAKDHIKWATDRGYLNGTGNYAFSPNTNTDRAMAITSIYRMAGSPSAGTSTSFTDVSSSAYYAKAVNWGVNNKIVSGTSSTTFSPTTLITREQVAVMLYNYAKYKGKNVTATGNLSQFPDGSSVSSWAQTAMKWAVGKGIFSGNDSGYLKPKSYTTRGELCALLQKYTNKA